VFRQTQCGGAAQTDTVTLSIIHCARVRAPASNQSHVSPTVEYGDGGGGRPSTVARTMVSASYQSPHHLVTNRLVRWGARSHHICVRWGVTHRAQGCRSARA
jgi:hypothetical protein